MLYQCDRAGHNVVIVCGRCFLGGGGQSNWVDRDVDIMTPHDKPQHKSQLINGHDSTGDKPQNKSQLINGHNSTGHNVTIEECIVSGLDTMWCSHEFRKLISDPSFAQFLEDLW